MALEYIVYVVITQEEYEDSIIQSIYSDKCDAEKKVKELRDNGTYYDVVTIEEFILR